MGPPRRSASHREVIRRRLLQLLALRSTEPRRAEELRALNFSASGRVRLGNAGVKLPLQAPRILRHNSFVESHLSRKSVLPRARAGLGGSEDLQRQVQPLQSATLHSLRLVHVSAQVREHSPRNGAKWQWHMPSPAWPWRRVASGPEALGDLLLRFQLQAVLDAAQPLFTRLRAVSGLV